LSRPTFFWRVLVAVVRTLVQFGPINYALAIERMHRWPTAHNIPVKKYLFIILSVFKNLLAIAITFTLVIIEIFVLQCGVTIVCRICWSIFISSNTFLPPNQSTTTCWCACIQV